MSCRTTPAGSALATIARLTSGGLNDIQTLSIFHARQREATRQVSQRAPSADEWNDVIDDHVALVTSDDRFTDARQRSVLERLREARDTVPDGQTYYTLSGIIGDAQRAGTRLTTTLESVATDLGITADEARARYDEYEATVDRSRDASPPEGYDAAARRTLRNEGLPSDRGTYYAINRLRQDVQAVRVERARSGPQRITRTPCTAPDVPGMGGLAEMGYDPDGGRLEVVLRADSQQRVYAYTGVSQRTWDDMQANGQTDAIHIYNSMIRNSSRYRYADANEEVLDGAARRCPDCGQYAANGHACPPRDARLAREQAEREAARAAAEAAARVEAERQAQEAERRNQALRDNAVLIEQGQPLPPRPATQTLREHYSWTGQVSRRFPPQQDTAVRNDYATVPPVDTVRDAATVGPVEFSMQYSGRRESVGLGRRLGLTSSGLPLGSFDVSGPVLIDNPATGHWAMDTSALRCSCAEYRANYDCPHIRHVDGMLRSTYLPAGVNADPDGPAATALSTSAVEAALRHDWTRSQEYAAEARERWRPSAPEDTYSTNFAAFQEDYQAALDRRAQGESAVPYMTSDATNGICTPGGRAFGIEIEFDGGDLDAIGEDLYNEGLTSSEYQLPYGAAREDGYSESHQGGWSFEEDCTVDGEIVSPVMYDTPETWEKIAKVCEIVRRHGGTASARTGSHVHVSAGSYDHTVENHTELVRMANQHEDVLYRVSQNPEATQHRPMQWCGPNRDVAPAGYQDIWEAQGSNDSHNYGVNLQSVGGDSSDHVEIRHWDGTLDPAVIQAQVKISAGMVEAAQRNASLGPSRREREPVGSHYRRLQALRGRSRRNLTEQEMADDTATARSFADTLFSRRADKAQFAALFAVTNWNRR